jgi:ornithine carbamoyltransferase
VIQAPKRHFLDIAPLPASDLRAILDAAAVRKAGRGSLPRGAQDADAPLAGHVLAMIFQKASTRTRVSFDGAIRQLGGSALVMSASEMQLGRGETVQDTARVIGSMVDAVMIRANAHQDVLDYAAVSPVPVINGLTNLSHPCQILADLQAIEERLGDVKGRTIAWVGDGNNVCTSYIHAAGKLGFSLQIACPEGYAPPTQEVQAAQAAGAKITLHDSPAKAAAAANVVVTDTWVSMGDEDKDQRYAAFPPYQVNEALMSKAAKDAVFLHCLPAHRGEEATDAVLDGPNSGVWDAAENRLHAQKAILLWCFGLVSP